MQNILRMRIFGWVNFHPSYIKSAKKISTLSVFISTSHSLCPSDISPKFYKRNLGESVIYIFAFLSRRLLLTTETLLNAIANAASMGLINPIAAAGIRMTL